MSACRSRRRAAMALALALAPLAGCADQPIGSFERPNYVAAPARAQMTLAFAPGSGRLGAGEEGRLSGFLRGLVLRPNDDIVLTFGESGSNVLDRQRIATMESAVARAGTPARLRIVDNRGFSQPGGRADVVLVEAFRFDVLVVNCTSGGLTAAEAEQIPPLGCANAANVAHMAASVRDLTDPRVLGAEPAILAAPPVARLAAGEVKTAPQGSAGDR